MSLNQYTEGFYWCIRREFQHMITESEVYQLVDNNTSLAYLLPDREDGRLIIILLSPNEDIRAECYYPDSETMPHDVTFKKIEGESSFEDMKTMAQAIAGYKEQI